ncbi:hypothetical protein MSG28_004922 [Choristoneura fumiferana]|uniref:Uncharacterized protein n=1 Tax=Choristoneura fumiferana TaxID=7141 RepID=A0ACC0JP41_CHOFU|nr:hypothetical protein MSG28_004922 [Choristoneura fumiferana]
MAAFHDMTRNFMTCLIWPNHEMAAFHDMPRNFMICLNVSRQIVERYNMLGGVTVNNDFDHFNSKKLTLMMKSIVDQGAPPPAGINLRLHRATDPRGVLTHYLKYVDALAKALRVACNIVGEQVFNKHIQQRYISYHSGLGSRLVGGEVSMEECEEYHK